MFAHDEIDHLEALEINLLVFNSLHAARHKRVASLHDSLAMNCRIVKGVTCHHLLLVAGTACTETTGVIVTPIERTVELKLRAHIVDLLHVGHAMVFLIGKACHGACIKPVGRTHTGKAVHNHHSSLATRSNTTGEHLAWEGTATLVKGDNLVGMYFVIFDFN